MQEEEDFRPDRRQPGTARPFPPWRLRGGPGQPAIGSSAHQISGCPVFRTQVVETDAGRDIPICSTYACQCGRRVAVRLAIRCHGGGGPKAAFSVSQQGL